MRLQIRLRSRSFVIGLKKLNGQLDSGRVAVYELNFSTVVVNFLEVQPGPMWDIWNVSEAREASNLVYPLMIWYAKSSR